MERSFRKIHYKFRTWIRFLMKSYQKWQKNEKYGIGPHIEKIVTQKGLRAQSPNFFQIIRTYICTVDKEISNVLTFLPVFNV